MTNQIEMSIVSSNVDDIILNASVLVNVEIKKYVEDLEEYEVEIYEMSSAYFSIYTTNVDVFIDLSDLESNDLSADDLLELAWEVRLERLDLVKHALDVREWMTKRARAELETELSSEPPSLALSS